jgi:hypothetical protein
MFLTVVGAISLNNNGSDAQATVFKILANRERIKFRVEPSVCWVSYYFFSMENLGQ